MDLISAAAEQNRDEALARAMHDTKSMQACRTKVNLPSAEKCEVDINRARSDMSLSDVMTDSVRARPRRGRGGKVPLRRPVGGRGRRRRGEGWRERRRRLLRDPVELSRAPWAW